jgi:hypothetical protein
MPLLAELIAFLRHRCYKDFDPTELRIHRLNQAQSQIAILL